MLHMFLCMYFYIQICMFLHSPQNKCLCKWFYKCCDIHYYILHKHLYILRYNCFRILHYSQNSLFLMMWHKSLYRL